MWGAESASGSVDEQKCERYITDGPQQRKFVGAALAIMPQDSADVLRASMGQDLKDTD